MLYFASIVKKGDIIREIQAKRSYLCTGLDTEMGKLPQGIERTGKGLLEFNKSIVEATAAHSVAYKINTAFYEQYGVEGWRWMEETLSYLPSNTLKIADAKRGDIGNTSTMYARAFFDALKFDAITVSPYMGEDSLRPFLEFENKFVICLALTSNAGHADFQTLGVQSSELKLYERVINTVSKWGNPDQLMFVVGATRAELVGHIRKMIPDHFLLVPGVGAQGGSLSDITHAAANPEMGLLVNSSRGIIYASQGADYKEAAEREAAKLASEMSGLMQQLGM
ncbi:MAG: orotidine-5-phosphate decarboxylase [Bacteroidota bacterium]